MLSFEEIEDCFPNGAVSLPDGWIGVTAQWMHDLARAIEAEVLPEGCVAVPRIVTPAIEAVYGNDSGAYGTAQELHDAMIAAAPKAQECSCQQGQMCLVCDPDIAQSKPAQAEKQEPVKDEPVAYLAGMYRSVIEGKAENIPLGATISFINMGWKNQIELYTHPQPDLTAEVERR
ncbi:MAG: hypothetical protein IPL32_17580 [Chloracidobacterium sp.]|nr:hypothetical protein [Chloracidobacterium sp.]